MGVEHDRGVARRDVLKGIGAAALTTVVGSAEAQAAPEQPFAGWRVERVNAGEIVRKWADVLPKIDADMETLSDAKRGLAAEDRAVSALLRVLDTAHRYAGRALLGWLNQGVNLSIAAKKERNDAWSSPLEAIRSGGDCEEYAFTKWLGLRRLGVRESDMMIIITKAKNGPDDHAFLAVRLEEEWLILDNRRMQLLQGDVALREHIPLYALERPGVMRFVGPRA